MQNQVVSREEWLEARRALLLKEKEATHLRDKVNAARMALPWVKVDKDYAFDTPAGRKSLSDLFDGRSQLIDLPFHAGPGLGGGLPRLLLPVRPCRWRPAASEQSRRHLGRGLARPARQDRGLQEPHGLELPLGVVGGQRFQLRLSRLLHAGGSRQKDKVEYNFTMIEPAHANDELPGLSAFIQER
jgi:hypothetical protein